MVLDHAKSVIFGGCFDRCPSPIFRFSFEISVIIVQLYYRLLGTILLALCIVYLGYAIMDITVKSWRTRHIPSPPSLPLIGHVHYLLNEPWIQFNRFAAKYGSLYKLQVWNKTFVVVSDPALVKEILKEKRLDYPKDDWSYSMMS